MSRARIVAIAIAALTGAVLAILTPIPMPRQATANASGAPAGRCACTADHV